jgi:hypothetical protein
MSAKKTRSKRNHALVVLGMHRSGTSALAGVLAQLGCDLPNHLIPANEFNEKGYFESLRIYNLNDAILASGGSSWDDWQTFNPDWIDSPRADEFLERGTQVLADEFGASRLFVLKDPRICRLMPFWHQLFESNDIHPFFLHCHRNPIEVANSLEHRENWPFTYGLLLWLRHVLEAEYHSRGRDRHFTSYDRVLQSWAAVMARLQSKAGIKFPRFSDSVGEEVDAFLSPNLRHNVEAKENISANPLLSKWISRTFEILERWSDTGEQPDDFPELDTIRTEFNAAAPMFGRIVQTVRRNVQELADLSAKNAEEIATRQATESRLTDAQDALEQAKQQTQENRKRLEQADQKTTELQAQIAAQEARMDVLAAQAEQSTAARQAIEDQLTITQDALKQAKQETAALHTRIAERDDRVGALTAQAEQNAAARQAAETQLADSQAALDQAEQQSHVDQNQLDARSQELRTAQDKISEQHAALTTLEQERSTAVLQRSGLEAQLDEHKERLGSLHEQMKNLEEDKWQIQSELAQRTAETEELTREKEELASKLEQLLSRADSLTQERDKARADLDALGKAKRLLQVQLQEDLEKQIADITTRTRKAYNVEAEKLQGEIRTLLDENQKNAAENATLTNTGKQQQAQILNLEKQHKDVTSERDKLANTEKQQRAQILDLEALNNETAAERDKLASTEKHHRDATKAARDTAHIILTERDALAETAEQLRAHIAHLESSQAEIMNSSSWKITAPLRRLASLLER